MKWHDNSDNVPLLPVNSRSSAANSESTALECPTAVQQCTRGQFSVDLFTTELITPLHDTTVTNRHAYQHIYLVELFLLSEQQKTKVKSHAKFLDNGWDKPTWMVGLFPQKLDQISSCCQKRLVYKGLNRNKPTSSKVSHGCCWFEQNIETNNITHYWSHTYIHCYPQKSPQHATLHEILPGLPIHAVE